MIGLGTQDSGDLAIDFVASTGTHSFPMYWDDTGSSWLALDVVSQPAGVLLSPSGDELGSWRGEIPFDEVLALAGEL